LDGYTVKSKLFNISIKLLNFLKFKLFKIMKNLKKLFAPLSIVLFSAIVFSSCKSDDPVAAPKDITVVATENGSFKTLLSVATKVGLVSTLQGPGPLTVFAPNDAAFAKVDLSKTSDADLKATLLYHVLGAKVLAADIKTGQTEVASAGTPKMYITKNANGVFINGNTKVIATDVNASNGVIHVLDNVLTDIPSKTITKYVVDGNDFSTLETLVIRAGLADLLSSGAYTVFAPTNAAFEELFKTVNPNTLTTAQIKNILEYHVVAGRVFSPELANGEVTMANGGKVTIDLTSGVAVRGKSNTATTTPKVIIANVMATNGVIHAIDKVLLP
jgi:uncharacterized surface protein with fasciclin (FAS1) repeats